MRTYIVKTVLEHMVHEKDTIPDLGTLVGSYREVLKNELRHWEYQITCWEDGSYGFKGAADAKREGLIRCDKHIQQIKSVLDQLGE